MQLPLSQQDDNAILQKIQDGNHHAFAELVARHTRRFYSISYRFLFNKNDAEDIVQKAFIKLWENPESWKAHRKTKFTTWFYRIIVNLCIDDNRKKPMIPLTTSKSILETPFTNELPRRKRSGYREKTFK